MAPISNQPIDPSSADVANKVLKALEGSSSAARTLVNLTKTVGDNFLTQKIQAGFTAAESLKIETSVKKQLDVLKEHVKLSDKDYNILVKELGIHAKNTAQLSIQKMMINAAVQAEYKKLGILEKELKTEKEIQKMAKEIAAEKKKEMDAKKYKKTINAVNAVGHQAENMHQDYGKSNVKEGFNSLSDLGGPVWGPVIKMISNMIGAIAGADRDYKKLGGEVVGARASIGQYASSVRGKRGINDIGDQMKDLQRNGFGDNGLDELGLRFDQVRENIITLNKAGIDLTKTLDKDHKTLRDQVKPMEDITKMSMNMGVSLESLGSSLVNLRRSSKMENDEVELSQRLAKKAGEIARKDIMSQEEFMSTVVQASDVFSELNFDTDKTVDLMGDLVKNIKDLGVTGKTTREITGQLTNSFKSTGDAWKAFIGLKNGSGGGFLGGLFKAQQRGPNGDLLNAHRDPRIFMKETMNMIKGQVGGISDPRVKMYLAEQIGGNMGLDAKSTQALLKGVMGSSKEQAEAVEEMNAAAEEVTKNSQDLLQEIAESIKNKILPLLGDMAKGVGALADWFVGGEKSSTEKNLEGMAEPLSRLIDSKVDPSRRRKTQMEQHAGGGEIYNTGVVLAHMGEEILSPNIARQYRKNRNMNNNGGINIGDINVSSSGDPRSVARTVGKVVEQKVLAGMKKNNRNTWG